MLGAGGALAGVTAGIPRVVLEVLKANLPRMTVRLHALHAVVRQSAVSWSCIPANVVIVVFCCIQAQNRAGKLVFPNEEFDVRCPFSSSSAPYTHHRVGCVERETYRFESL